MNGDNGAGALPERTLTMVIGALGGEGGGVLTAWIVGAAESQGFPVQSTSIPGVAQRTGATTYYVEIYPAHRDRLDGASPAMAMYPTPDNMDIVVTSELMEAGRALENGMVTADRTTLIASTHRVYSILERSAMADGLFDGEKLLMAAEKLANRAILFDISRLAAAQDTVLNAVVLGVIAGTGQLPIPAEAFEQAIRDAGVAVESNLRGFRAGLAYLRGELALPPADSGEKPSRWARGARIDDLLAAVEGGFPPETHRIVQEGVRRLVDYQGAAYAGLYLDCAREILAVDKAGGGAERGFALTAEAARYLALWMSYEDIIRVADLKSRGERMARLRAEVGAKDGEPVIVTEFLKPGFEEVASVMPPAVGRAVMRWAQRTAGRRNFHLAMRVKTNTFLGFLRLWLLARFKWWRPRTYRYAEEQAEIARWLGAVSDAGGRDYALALEIAELPRLRKGYSDTHRRGAGNYRRIFETLAVPAAAGEGDAAKAAEALRAAREAALADDSGKALDETLAGLGIRSEAAPAVAPPPRPDQTDAAAAE